MKFDDLDKQLRIYETLNDTYVLPGIYMVARIDGRSFTRLTRELHNFKAPFDEQFRDYMIQTVMHLMDCGFRVVFGYTQSDEISLLFHRDEDGFARKIRKYNSILAGEASAKLSTLLRDVAAFDCRISQLPTSARVVDYFRWRNEDAHRNALNGHCYWNLRKKGENANQATEHLTRMTTAEKNELLFQEAGINFNDLPLWQRRGIGFYWEDYTKKAHNPITDQPVTVTRRRIKVDMELPMKDDFSQLVHQIIQD